jgi:hypothetical protein
MNDCDNALESKDGEQTAASYFRGPGGGDYVLDTQVGLEHPRYLRKKEFPAPDTTYFLFLFLSPQRPSFELNLEVIE